jgi:hypothetical protein
MSSTWGPGALAPVFATIVAASLLTALLTAPPAGAHDGDDGTQVVTTTEPDPDDEGWVQVSRHLDPIEELTSDRKSAVAAVAGSSGSGASESRSPAESCAAVSRTTDDATNNYHPASNRVLKVIYAYPTDVGNRIGTYSPVIQTGIRWLTELAAGESGNRRALRFDLGTTSGAGCVDIQVVPLSLPASSYTAVPSQTFALLRTELLPRVLGQPGNRNYLVYADGVTVSGVGGEAQVRSDDSPGGAQHGLGNLWAMVYGRGGTDFFGSSAQYAPGTTSRTHVDIALHEVSHTLGAVQRSVPHASAAFHCLDEWDVLCYDDDGSGGRSTYVACNTPGAQYWDCNKDDYFNPTPAPGSYLASHWTLFNSVFMCPAGNCAPGGVTGPPDFAAASGPAPDTTITKLGIGRHRFSVYASGEGGGRWDDSPEIVTFTIIKTRRARGARSGGAEAARLTGMIECGYRRKEVVLH